MKLLFCRKCEDLFRLTKEERFCSCGEIWGRYLDDGLHAEYSGENAVPLFIANGSFVQAVLDRPHSGKGSIFIAGVIPEVCDTMKDVGE
jgi:hypothetical protein